MKTLFNIALLLFSAVPFMATDVWAENAADQLLPWPENVAYELSYLRAPIGKVEIHSSHGNNLSQMNAAIEVAGIAKLFSDFYNTQALTYEGLYPKHGKVLFHNVYHKGDNNNREITFEYDESGAFKNPIRKNIHDMARRDAISKELLDASYDPLSLMLTLRRDVYQAVQAGTSKLTHHMYDGKRLYKLDVTIYGTRLFEWKGRHVSVQKVGLMHKIAGGMTAKEKKRKAGYQFPETVLYFTADQSFLPIYGKQPWMLGSFKVTMQ